MMQIDLLRTLLQADFMQTMVLGACLFLLPLEHRKGWRRAALLCALAALGLGVCNTAWVYATNYALSASQAEPSFLLPPSYLLSILVYYLSPLLAAYFLFRLCTRVSRADALYGMSCVYAVQHIAFCLTVSLWGEHVLPVPPLRTAGDWLVNVAVFALAWPLLARRLPVEGHYRVTGRKSLIFSWMVLLIALLVNYVARQFNEAEYKTLYVICTAYDLLSCLFLLALQAEQRRESDLRVHVETERRLRRQMKEQYELSRDSIEIINRKCHDLKHQISALRLVQDPARREEGLREIERSAMIYDAAVQTGNQVLDTVLTEKSLLCERGEISWTCMADGKLLRFMSPVDLYTLFGNALDNAIESSRTVTDPERRHVSVTVHSRHGAALIQVENYFDHPIRLSGGLPATTKSDAAEHGYGIPSIRDIAQRYGGTMDISAADGLFQLSVLIPVPQSG